jgi:hypothetical protein
LARANEVNALEYERDAAIKRAEAAEAKVATLTRELEEARAGDMFRRTPAPATTHGSQARPELTAEDRAWMDAMQAECAVRPWNVGNVRELAHAAIAARELRKGGVA